MIMMSKTLCVIDQYKIGSNLDDCKVALLSSSRSERMGSLRSNVGLFFEKLTAEIAF